MINTTLHTVKQSQRHHREKAIWPGGASAHTNRWYPKRSIRTFLADDSPFMLALLARILRTDERIAVIGSATDGRKVLHTALTSHLDLVLIDLNMHGSDGAEVTQLLKKCKKPPVVFIVTSDDSFEARVRTLRAGADAYLLKTENLAVEIQTAIRNSFGHGPEHRAGAQARGVLTATE